ncbi:Gfo/Idh/MocA family protein [Pseudoroseicyclus aestuarii]|uniref:Putative dehydrogenase n=1 Tax=Pseudoroseicyclus aestuarii TaxID=1795041 RepID=A0A318SQ80_9RHOB|nr:Gfo/Idh/MocA family oxidoreductase [Pseudoroseicyclus aestuarii]PYE83832.1 putative dehydrogenase [Pseudoroseicyclus aestuarii]
MPDTKTSRRAFLRSSALGLGAGTLGAGPLLAQAASGVGTGGTPPAPDLPTSATGRPMPSLDGFNPEPAAPEDQVGWAVCGLGHFAQNYVVPSIVEAGQAKLTGLISGTPEKLSRLGMAYGVPEGSRYGYDMAGLAEDDSVQVVYVVTPNAIHEENVIAAFEAGKDVMCEKPFAADSAAAQRMLDARDANGRKLMIAYRAHYEPHNLMLKGMYDRGELGDVRFATADHHRPLDPSATRDQWRMRRDLAGGGSLMDIGIYSLNGLIWLLGEVPVRLAAQTHAPGLPDDRFAEIEAICTATLDFPSGRTANISSGYIANKKRIDLWGADVTGVLDPATSYTGNRLTLSTAEGTETPMAPMPSEQQFMGEIDAFSRAVRDGNDFAETGETGLRDMHLMEAIYAAAERGEWVSLNRDGRVQ